MTESTDRPQFTKGQRVLVEATIVRPEPDRDGDLKVEVVRSSGFADRLWCPPRDIHPMPVDPEPTVTHHGTEPVPQRVLCALRTCEHVIAPEPDANGCLRKSLPEPPEITAARAARLAADAKAHDGRTLGQVAHKAFYVSTDADPWEAAAQAVVDALPSGEVVDAVVYCGVRDPWSDHECALPDGHIGVHRADKGGRSWLAPPPMGEAVESNNAQPAGGPPPHYGFYRALSDRLAGGDLHYAWPSKPDRAECYDRAVELYFKHHEDEDSDYPWDDDDHAFVLRIARFLAGDPS